MPSLIALIGRIEDLIIDPLILLLGTVALVLFFWGLAQFILNAGSEEKRSDGKRHMLWGIIGLFIIIAVIGIINVLGNTFGF